MIVGVWVVVFSWFGFGIGFVGGGGSGLLGVGFWVLIRAGVVCWFCFWSILLMGVGGFSWGVLVVLLATWGFSFLGWVFMG